MSTLWRTSSDIIYYGESAVDGPGAGQLRRGAAPARRRAPATTTTRTCSIVGMPGFTAAQNRTHMSLWAISGAPLLAGNNLATMSTRHPGDPDQPRGHRRRPGRRCGRQGVKVAEDTTGLQVYSKVLSGTGRRAVLLLNRTARRAEHHRPLGRPRPDRPSAARPQPLDRHRRRQLHHQLHHLRPRRRRRPAHRHRHRGRRLHRTRPSPPPTPGPARAANATCANCSGGSQVGYVGNGAANTLRVQRHHASATGRGPPSPTSTATTTARTATLQVNGQQPTVVLPADRLLDHARTDSVLVGMAKGSAIR